MSNSIKLTKSVLILLLIFVLLPETAAFAQGNDSENTLPQTPTLVEVSFKNAVVNEEFLPYKNDYTLTLIDDSVSPTLKNYKINGDAEIFVNYILDDSHRQTGICVTLEFDSGSTIYNFYYKNAKAYSVSSNNNLSELKGNAVEVYPKITDDNDEYTLFIPSDMTELELTAVTQDVSARCDMPSVIKISLDQEPVIPVTVTASNGKTRLYEFKVKRTDKTTAQVESLIKNNGRAYLARDELIYRNPVFYIVIGGAVFGAAVVFAIVQISKQISLKAYDGDEKPFFENME